MPQQLPISINSDPPVSVSPRGIPIASVRPAVGVDVRPTRHEPAPSPLRIVHLVAPADFGGLERVVHALVVGQQERGHRVSVIALVDVGRETNHPLVVRLAGDGADVEAIALPPRAYAAERERIRRALAAAAPDVVHTHGARVDVLHLPVARRAGVATVTTVHGFTGGGLRNQFYEYLQRRAIRQADAVVAVSNVLASTLVASGIPTDRVHGVPNAAPERGQVVARNEARRRLGVVDEGGPVVGWVGRLTGEKGADLFLEAVARLPRRVRAVVVGEGAERPSLERQASRLGISDRVRFTGVVDRADRVISAFDLFVMSSRTEGTPIVLFEAIAAGVPIVATAVGGIPSVVGARGALLVEPGDALLLATAMTRALDDPAGANERAVAAFARMSTESASGPWLDRYDAIYRSVRRA
jgi:glycosyltransferase involved in cell wall biosynthesis